MRISIWQQFSSNHSSSFTVVGEFNDIEAAQNAAVILRGAAKSIANWYSENKEIRHAVVEGSHTTPTLAEQHICEQYSISCERPLDWLANCGFVEEMVSVYSNHVFMTNKLILCDGWAGETLFDELMAKFAVRTFIDEENTALALVDIDCSARNVSNAESIRNAVLPYLTSTALIVTNEIPWMSSYLAKRANGDETLRDYYLYLARLHAEKDWDIEHAGLLDELFQKAGLDRYAWPGTSQHSLVHQEFRNRKIVDLESVEEISIERQIPVTAAVADIYAHIYESANGGVDVDGSHISLSGLSLGKISVGLPVMIQWLSEQGCADISYRFEQH